MLGAALVSPWIYMAIHWAAANWGGVALNYLAEHPFYRVFNRVLQVELILGIGFFLKRDGFFSWQALGFKRVNVTASLLFGLGSSVVLMVLFSAVLLGLGWQRWETPGAGLAALASRIMATAVAVSLFEEILFRGYFYQLCRRQFSFRTAVTINMVVFSLVHFVKPSKEQEIVMWSSGFKMLALACRRFAAPMEILGGLLVVAMVAWILCWSVERTRSLWLALGVHAGLICAQQWNASWTHPATTWPAWVLGGGDLRDGIVTLVPLAIQFCLLRWWAGRNALAL